MTAELIEVSGATFSPCEQYRYTLWRHWDFRGPENVVMFIGLNPSKADAVRNDKTVSNCIGFAKRWGFGGMYMMNLFGYRATYPENMIAQDDPVGIGNDAAFAEVSSKVGLVVAAWGSVPTRYRPRLEWQSRIQTVMNTVYKPVFCLGQTKDGSPRHPSRLGYATERKMFWMPGERMFRSQ